MWDTAEPASGHHLTHDLPCSRCGHAIHTYLACSDTCACEPGAMPGTIPLISA